MKASGWIERGLYWLALAGLCWLLITFLYGPILLTFEAAFVRDGTLAINEAIAELARSRRVRLAIWNTLWMTAATTVTVSIVGVFQVLALEYFRVRGRSIMRIAFAIPLVFGSIFAASGYRFTYGPNGVVTMLLQDFFPNLPKDWFIGWFGVLFIHTFLMTSFYFLFLRAAMRRIDYATIEAARSLGASEWRILTRVVLPVIMSSYLAVTLLTIYVAIGSFAAPTILGGRDFFMLSELIINLNSFRRSDMAALLALLSGVVVTGLILLSLHYEAKNPTVGGAKTPTPIKLRQIRSPIGNFILHTSCYLLIAIYILPVALVILFSFAPSASIGVETFPSRLWVDNYVRVLTDPKVAAPFYNSLKMASLSVLVGLIISIFSINLMLNFRNWAMRLLDVSLFLPWLLPNILIAIGLIIAFDDSNWFIGGGSLLGTFWLLPIGYTIVILPLMIRFLRATFVGIEPEYDLAARSLGASALYRFRRVTLPLITPTAILVAAMAFNDLMTEYPLSAFLYSFSNIPLPIVIVNDAMSQDPEHRGINLVYSVLIMGFSLAVILFADRAGLGRGPEVNRI